jgi:hypothetical protein
MGIKNLSSASFAASSEIPLCSLPKTIATLSAKSSLKISLASADICDAKILKPSFLKEA